MVDDQRVAPRFVFSEPVEYGLPDIMVNGSIAGNLSLSGISLRVHEFVPVGIVLELQLRLGKTPQITWVRAEVVRVREILSEDCFEIGLKFIPDQKSIKAIGEYIDACRSKTTV